MAIKYPDDWKEFLSLLVKHRVRFLIVGAHALASMGRPRHTGDLDIWVDPTPTNARCVTAAMREFGFGEYADEEFFATRQSGLRGIQMGVEPMRIDVLSNISGVTFAEAWRGSRKVRIAGRTVRVIGRAAYIKNKRAAGRPKDLLDISLLGTKKRRKYTKCRRRW